MKIVTAGQRGSVATGDEIRKKRHNKYRPFSYSLILLFSLCCGGEAAAAKLCYNLGAAAAAPGGAGWSETSRSIPVPGFLFGSGCQRNGYHFLDCAQTTFWGIGRCAASAGAYTADTDLMSKPEVNDNDTHCFCQIQYPFKGKTIYAGVCNLSAGYPESCGWPDHCARICVEKMQTDAAFMRSMLVG